MSTRIEIQHLLLPSDRFATATVEISPSITFDALKVAEKSMLLDASRVGNENMVVNGGVGDGGVGGVNLCGVVLGPGGDINGRKDGSSSDGG